ncbi:MAG: hypothetical protein HUU01_13875 [Saprospiraceae bacterium]|nr:hypothetical protein [Saprospiraceae bacterium]
MKYSKALTCCFFLFLLALIGCEQEREQAILPDTSEHESPELAFKFEQCIKLYDGEFFVDYCVQSNLESEIEKILLQNPKVRISPYHAADYPETDTPENFVLSEQTDLPPTDYDVSEVIKSSNVPHGYKAELYYSNKNVSDDFSFRSWANRYYSDSGAIGVYVAHGGYTVPTFFDSRGFLNIGWKERGNRTIGPNNTHSHTFNTTVYTSYRGARARAYTTLPAWNAMTKIFLY